MRTDTAAIYISLFLIFSVSGAPAQDVMGRLIPGHLDICGGFLLEGTHKTYTTENMYEHVNGEAELLKRYGATGLAYAAYSSKKGDSLTVDMIDMGKSENAYGLYRLYSGCEEGMKEIRNEGFTIFVTETTSFAVRGNLFLRINAFDSNEGCPDLPVRAAERIFSPLNSDEPIPFVARTLEKHAGRACDVAYLPDDVDFERGLGAGYRWKGKGGENYYLKVCKSGDEAEKLSTMISKEDGVVSLTMENIVAWTWAEADEDKRYLLDAVRDVIKGREKTGGEVR